MIMLGERRCRKRNDKGNGIPASSVSRLSSGAPKHPCPAFLGISPVPPTFLIKKTRTLMGGFPCGCSRATKAHKSFGGTKTQERHAHRLASRSTTRKKRSGPPAVEKARTNCYHRQSACTLRACRISLLESNLNQISAMELNKGLQFLPSLFFWEAQRM
jgi:hypothetical protein